MVNNKNEGVYSPAFTQSRERLKQLTPEQIMETTHCPYDYSKECFLIRSFGHDFEIYYPEGDVFFAGSDLRPSIDWRLILLNFLSSARKTGLINQWVSYRELPGGNVFYPSVRTYVLDTLAKFFSDSNKEVLCQALVQLDFSLLESKADLEATGLFLSKIPLLIKFWEGEDEIASSCQLLFDQSISTHMHMEDIAALCGVVRDLIIKQYEIMAPKY